MRVEEHQKSGRDVKEDGYTHWRFKNNLALAIIEVHSKEPKNSWATEVVGGNSGMHFHFI